jgi:protein TonB
MMLSRNKKNIRKKLLLASTIIGTAVLFICQQAPQALAQQKKSTKITAHFVDKVAEFPGGNDSLMNFLSTHIHYPKTEKGKDTIERRIAYQFVIDENGKVQDPRILKGFDKRYDSAVIEGIQSMPKWKPAQNHGMPVSSYYTGVLIFNGN